ncbi:ACT domain-containing protein [Butyrivibrio sp. NC3005]|uniref:ACT domain-containing protein n=1 Tax=Butyrivibrio sp. NC3005 TaxID=1280685 RepID=UPI000426FC6F|nr:ACT domain-containing protein [Butyrivibrio sp. NC3005]
MGEYTGYYIVRRQAIPEVLIKVVEAKKLLESGKVRTVNEAVEKLEISRSSFYKYKDDIYEFHDSLQGNTYTLTFQMNDEPGLLSDVLAIIAASGANILTIHQSIPIDGVATLSISLQVLDRAGSVEEMAASIEKKDGVRKVQISGRGINIS